jgi:hypothetical protein
MPAVGLKAWLFVGIFDSGKAVICFLRRRMSNAARKAVAMVAVEPRAIPAIIPPERPWFSETRGEGVLSRVLSEVTSKTDVPVAVVLVVSAASAVIDVDADFEFEVVSLEDVEDASTEDREMELIRHRTEPSLWSPETQVVC